MQNVHAPVRSSQFSLHFQHVNIKVNTSMFCVFACDCFGNEVVSFPMVFFYRIGTGGCMDSLHPMDCYHPDLEQPIEPPILVWVDSVADCLRVAGRDVSADHRSALDTTGPPTFVVQPTASNNLYFAPPMRRDQLHRGIVKFTVWRCNRGPGTCCCSASRERYNGPSMCFFHNQDTLVSILNATREQAVQNHGDILTLASNLSSLDVLHRFLHLVDQLDQIQLRRRWYLAACEAMRSGHLSRDVMSDVRLDEVLSLLSDWGEGGRAEMQVIIFSSW